MKGSDRMAGNGLMMQYFEWYLDDDGQLWNRLGSLTLTNRKSIRKAREGLFFLSNLSVKFCVT